MAGVSPWFSTHFSNKNTVYYSDNLVSEHTFWCLAPRLDFWPQLIALLFPPISLTLDSGKADGTCS